MIKEIVFDLDGSIVDLYGVPNWLEKIRAYDPTPYQTAKPLVDMAELACLSRANFDFLRYFRTNFFLSLLSGFT